MTTTDDLRRSRPTPPPVVRTSVVLWGVWLVVGVVSTVVVSVSDPATTGAGVVLALVLAFVVWAAVAAATVLVLRGSAVARIVLVAIALLRAVLSVTDGGLSPALVLLSVVAAVLLFLPSARPFFRRADTTEPSRASRSTDPDRPRD
ncbi:hypothetical protein Q7F20_01535 [Curtobacterium sp. A7_M15]|uniref:hypothetical protein n=1 Tax=Curtobacterium sp. A7_M15 TaxID=3065241 RepID=UPI002737BCFD|nr:hypothetical protein [Curtobacterium sp. A7_M15]MDP4332040.1 hypothetical protein [Curtobacterium sp. A7_M15]